jgi:predicted aspartyl protease
MGVFKVRARLWNPSDNSKEAVVDFVVDTGATYTVLPANVLEGLAVGSIRMVKLKLADNRVLEKKLGEAGIEIEGYTASATPVIFGEEGVYLLGSVTMEQLGLAPDPVEKKLKPVEALMM